MKKRILAVLLTMAMAVSMAACGTEQKPAEAPEKEAAATEGELEDFDIVLDWYPNAVHAFIYEAMEKGYYEDEGLKVNIRFPSNTNDAVSLTAAGKADLGIYYLKDVIITRVNEKVPVKAVGTLVQSPLAIVLSLKEKNIKSPADLIGKTIGYSGSALAETVVKSNMENVGAKAEDVKMVDVGFDLMTSMTTGNVDATIDGYINHEMPQMEKEGFDVNYYFVTDYGVPDYYELVFVAGEKALEENPEKIAKFLRASKKGFDDVKADPEAALQLLLKNQNKENFPLIDSVEKQSMDILLPLMEKEEAPFLTQSTEIWQNNVDWMFEKGLINEKVDAAEMLSDVWK